MQREEEVQYYLPHFPLASHFFAVLAESHFFAPSHLELEEHLAPVSASFPEVHPVNATIANPNNAVKINFFILSPNIYFDSVSII
jgi:hypothetical protein